MMYRHPVDIPMSKKLAFEWTGERIACSSVNVRGDTYPVAWADDDGLYTGTGDPIWMMVDGRARLSETLPRSDEQYRATSGQVVEKFLGEPERFGVERIHDMPGYAGYGGHGAKPSGMVCVDGTLYYAVQNLLGFKPPRFREHSQHGSDAAILRSQDYGRTWTPDLNALLMEFEKEHYDRSAPEGSRWKTTPEQRQGFRDWKPMFPGPLFGGPSFIQFGRNNEHAVDDYVYAVSADHWDNGRDLRLGRVPKDAIMDVSRWEFAVPQEEGGVAWTPHLEESRPILEIDRHISLPEMVYVKSLGRYLLLTWALHTDFRTPTGSELTLLESQFPWGPFHLVHYEWMWHKRACCAYAPRVPLKWFNQESLEGHILFSGNWETHIPYYLPQTKRFKLSVLLG